MGLIAPYSMLIAIVSPTLPCFFTYIYKCRPCTDWRCCGCWKRGGGRGGIHSNKVGCGTVPLIFQELTTIPLGSADLVKNEDMVKALIDDVPLMQSIEKDTEDIPKMMDILSGVFAQVSLWIDLRRTSS